MKQLFIFLLIVLCSCHKKSDLNHSLSSIQIIDRNGFSETISNKDRLSRYEETNFLDPQPYQKVLRVFNKVEGKVPSKITSYHPNGYLWQELEILDGRAHGTYQEWHPNGTIKLRIQVIEGIADLSQDAMASWLFDGTCYVYNDHASCIAEICYNKGLLEGESCYYNDTHKLEKKIHYKKNELDGVATFYRDGIVCEEIPFINGKKEGRAYRIYENDALCYEEEFRQDQLLKGSYFSKEGVLLSKISSGEGVRIEWHEDQVEKKVEYKKGVPEGLVQILKKDGSISSSYMQKNGKKHGEEIEYYPTGTPKLLISWQEDVLHGKAKTWYETTLQESEREFYQNKKNGPALAWYENGDLMFSEEYENDLMISGDYYKKGDRKKVSTISHGQGIATIYDSEGHFVKKISYEKGIPCLE